MSTDTRSLALVREESQQALRGVRENMLQKACFPLSSYIHEKFPLLFILFVCKVKALLLLHLLYETEPFNGTSRRGLSYDEWDESGLGGRMWDRTAYATSHSKIQLPLVATCKSLCGYWKTVYPTESNFILWCCGRELFPMSLKWGTHSPTHYSSRSLRNLQNLKVNTGWENPHSKSVCTRSVMRKVFVFCIPGA